MANVYVRSGAGGGATGADWANAYLTLAAALTAKAAGDSFWVSEDHAETQASAMTLTSPGTAANPCFIYCVNHSGSVPPVSADLLTTGAITTTGNSNITFAGVAYCQGLIFNMGTGAVSPQFLFGNASTTWMWQFKNCAFKKLATGVIAASYKIGFAASSTIGQKLVLDGTTLTVGNTGDGVLVSGADLVWRNTASAIGGATLPTTLFTGAGVFQSDVFLEGVDLSALAAAKTLVAAPSAAMKVQLKDCKLGASVTVAAAPTVLGASIDLIRTDSGATNYRSERYRYEGTETVETTIVRTGGATDGTTTIAKKIVSTANSKWVLPFECLPIAFWNDRTSAITDLTIYGTTTGGGLPNWDDIWVDVEYLKDAGDPLGGFATTTKADNLAAAATTNLSTDASTWGGGGAGNGFKIVVPSFTPALKGPITLYVKVAKTSATYYIDPKPTMTGLTVGKSVMLAPGIYDNELSAGGAAGILVHPGMTGGMRG